VCDIARSD